jgi:hypothetical protein
MAEVLSSTAKLLRKEVTESSDSKKKEKQKKKSRSAAAGCELWS